MSDVGRYRKVFPRLWRHPGFLGLKPSARELVLYLLSGPQTNAIGLFHFSIATAAEDLGVGVETLRKALSDVAVTFGWLFDADARVVYIPSWWRFNRPENNNVLKGNLKNLSEIPPCALVEAFAGNLETLPETFHQTLIEGCRIRIPKRSSKQEQDQEHLHKQDHEHALRAKGGSDRSGRLLLFAREALKLNHPGASIELLVDTFRQIVKEPVDRPEVVRLLNIAIRE